MATTRLRSRAHKFYNMRSILRGIFWNAHNVLYMGGAADDGRTIQTNKQFAHIHLYCLCGARSGLYTSDMQDMIWGEPDLAA